MMARSIGHMRYCWISRRLLNHMQVELIRVEDAPIDDFKALDVRPFFKDTDRSWGHGAWQDTTDVRMMSPGRREEDDLPRLGIEDRRN